MFHCSVVGYEEGKLERENKVWQLKENQEDGIICISVL